MGQLTQVTKKEILIYFLKLGCVGFGGPVALAAIMQKELVEEKKWIDWDEFDQAFPLIKAMPGALAFQTAAYIGNAKGGFWGAVLAGFGLVLPAAVIMIVFGIFATTLKEYHWINQLLLGFQSGALALIVIACWQLARPYKKDIIFWVYILISLFFVINKWPEPMVILLFGGVNILRYKIKKPGSTAAGFPLLELLWICFSGGAFVFGTGLAVLPWLETQIVQNHHWLSQKEFLQAVALGQITPGPVLTTATYIGFKISGIWGGLLATIAVFLPGLIHMTTWFPRMVKRLSLTKWIRDFSMGALAAVVGTLIFVIYRYRPEVSTVYFWSFLASTLVLFIWRIPAWAIILICGAIGVAWN
jgi:chromate transporter